MAEKPPAWTESSGQIGQTPLMLSQDVDSTGVASNSGQDAHALAESIVRNQQPVIQRFVAKTRQQIEIGGKDIHNAVLPLSDMDVYYGYVQGLERMHYHISPQAEARGPPPEEPPAIEKPPPPAIPEVPTPPEPPEVPKPPEPPEVPKPPEPPEEPEKPEVPEKPEEEEKKEYKTPDFLTIDTPCYLAIEFTNGAE